MIIQVKKLQGRPKKEKKFCLSYFEFNALKKYGAVKVKGYLLTTKDKK